MAVLKDSIVNGDLIVTGKIQGYVKKEEIGTVIKYAGTVDRDYKNTPNPLDPDPEGHTYLRTDLGSDDIGTVYIVRTTKKKDENEEDGYAKDPVTGKYIFESWDGEVIWSYLDSSSGSMGWEDLGNTNALAGYYSKSEMNILLDKKIPKDTFTAAGQLLYSDNSESPKALNIGTDDFVLAVSNSSPKWVEKAPKSSVSDKLSTGTTGDANTPIYFNDGIPNSCSVTSSNSANNSRVVITNSDGIAELGKKINLNYLSPTLESVSSVSLEAQSNLNNTGYPGVLCSEHFQATKVYNAVWNDLADAIEVDDECNLEPGFCYSFDGINYTKTSKKADSHFIGIHSDTAGMILGLKGKKELNVAVAGFVLAYTDSIYEPGTPLIVTKNGYLTRADFFTRVLHPERVVATFWKVEDSEYWGDKEIKVKVNNRNWVKIK